MYPKIQKIKKSKFDSVLILWINSSNYQLKKILHKTQLQSWLIGLRILILINHISQLKIEHQEWAWVHITVRKEWAKVDFQELLPKKLLFKKVSFITNLWILIKLPKEMNLWIQINNDRKYKNQLDLHLEILRFITIMKRYVNLFL